jgi:hypothetical protein
MCPDRKTGWFKEHLKYSAVQIKGIKSTIIKAWKSKYAPDQPESSQVQKKDKSHKGRLVYIPTLGHIVTFDSHYLGAFQVGS